MRRRITQEIQVVLKLSRKDLGKPSRDEKPGIHVWWYKRPKGKSALLCVSWSGLILVNPRITWPDLLSPKAIDGWGQLGRSYRISLVVGWIPVPVIRADVPVPDLDPLMEVKRSDLCGLSYLRTDKRVATLAERDECVYQVRAKSLRRTASAFGKPIKDFDLRLLHPSWAPESLVVLCYLRDRLCSVVAVNG